LYINKERAGFIRKQLSGDMAYYTFVPSQLPPEPPIQLNNEDIELLVEAHKVLAILDDRTVNIPDMDLFISMHVRKEALLSSQIEGTQATLEDIFNPNISKNSNVDVDDVVNYIKATKYAIERIKTLPLCNRLLKETHKILLSGTRGMEKNPGEFRKSQNWIGGFGSGIKTAKYIPPDVDSMNEAMSDLEKYINSNDTLDPLIRIALIHYQFESIHPFLDGNGRIGRLLIILYLLENKVIKAPSIYLSLYLKQNRIEYYDRMSVIRNTGNYEQWIRFFLKGIYLSGQSAIETADKLIALKNNNLEKIKNENYSKRTVETMLKVFHYIEAHPIIDIVKTAEELSMAYNSIATCINKLEGLGILNAANKQARNKIYSYKEYIDVLSAGTEVDF